MSIWTRRGKRSRRDCPHVFLQGIYGDVIKASGGYRLQCVECWAFLKGPVALSMIDRDPEKKMTPPEGWKLGQHVAGTFYWMEK